MNTLQEISTSRLLNRLYWNGQVKLYIACYRVHTSGMVKTIYFECIKKALKSRTNYEYFGV